MAKRVAPETALLILHWQNSVCDPKGVWGKNLCRQIEKNNAVKNAQSVLATARNRGLLTIFVNIGWRLGFPELPENQYYPLLQGAKDENKGLVGTWEGGPQIKNKTFATWQYKSLFFATDPVALDRVGWEIIDKKRAAEGWPGVAQMGLDARTGIVQIDGKPYPEELHIRQPQHIALAATLGMGVFDLQRIDHRRFELM